MKDWEIMESYFLPRILYVNTKGNTLPNNLYKSNLRCLSLNGETDQWSAWRRYDYFYPEMIPEPDYSDSGEETEDEDVSSSSSSIYNYPLDYTFSTEGLRELAEVYVSTSDAKKSQARSTKATRGRGGSPRKASPRVPPKVRSPSAKSKRSPDRIRKSPDRTRQKKSPDKIPKKPLKSTTDREKEARTSAKAYAETTTIAPTSVTSTGRAPRRTSPQSRGREKSPTARKPAAGRPAPKKTAASPKKTITSKSQAGKRSPSPEKGRSPAQAKAGTKEKPTVVANQRAAKKPQEGAQPKKAESPTTSSATDKSKSPPSGTSPEQSSDEERLIKPKKVIPSYLQSTERQKLYRELKFSQKYGMTGASTKTELELALQRYTENKEKRELMAEEKTSLEKILEIQARKIEMQEGEEKSPPWMERLQKPPATMPDPKTDEFYRVHARVVNQNPVMHCFMPESEDGRDFEACKHVESGSDS